MQITYRIYSDELATFAPEGTSPGRALQDWTFNVYAQTLREALEARFETAEIAVSVIPRTSGYGSGPVVIDDEGLPLDDIAIEVREIANRVLESLSQASAGQTHANLGQGGIGAPGATDVPHDLYDYKGPRERPDGCSQPINRGETIMTDEQRGHADQIERKNWDESADELRAEEIERENDLWDAAATARAEDDDRRMGAQNEAQR